MKIIHFIPAMILMSCAHAGLTTNIEESTPGSLNAHDSVYSTKTDQLYIVENRKDSSEMDIQKKIEELLVLPDAHYLTLSQPDILTLQSELGKIARGDLPPTPGNDIRENPPVFALGGPVKIDLEKNSSIPLLIAAMQSGSRKWSILYDINSFLVISNLNTGKVYLHWPFYRDKLTLAVSSSDQSVIPNGIEAKATSSSVRLVDLKKEIIGLDWKNGEHTVTLVNYDLTSNTIRFNVSGATDPTDLDHFDDRVTIFEKYQEAYEQVPIGENGLSFSLPTHVKSDQTIKCNVKIDAASDMVQVKEIDEKMFLFVDLLMVKLDGDIPVHINICTPVESYLGKDDIKKNKVEFSLDIGRIASDNNMELNGSYMSYLVSGSSISGPNTISID
jgi:hypothetical protein